MVVRNWATSGTSTSAQKFENHRKCLTQIASETSLHFEWTKVMPKMLHFDEFFENATF